MRSALALSAAALCLLGAAGAQTYAVTNARVLMTGSADDPRSIRSATVLIEDGRIAGLGADIQVPATATVIDAQGGVVTPGMFAALSGLGLEEVSLNGEANDRYADENTGLSASYDAADGFYADSTAIAVSRNRGITRAFVAPDPGTELFGGCGMVVRLSADEGAAIGDAAITERCIAQHVALGYAGARREGDSRLGAMAALRLALDDARRYQQDAGGYVQGSDEGSLSARDAAALVPVLTGEQKLLAEVQGAGDILRLLDIAEAYGLDLVIAGGHEAWRVADRLVAADVPVILDPMQNLPDRFETFGATLEGAARLEAAGVTVAFYDNDIGYTHNIRLLPQLAGNAVRGGMSYAGALSAITVNPAVIWGVEGVGLVSEGGAADVVVWDGDPLELTSRPIAVFIDGELMDGQDRQRALAERYRDLSRAERPIAYRGAR